MSLTPRQLEQRLKQIDIGKQSDAYEAYVAYRGEKPKIPTPNAYEENRSKRSFDGLIRQWKKHLWAWYGVVTSENYHLYSIYEEPKRHIPVPSQARDIEKWKQQLLDWFDEEYLFTPDQIECLACASESAYREKTTSRTFCCPECQKMYYSL